MFATQALLLTLLCVVPFKQCTTPTWIGAGAVVTAAQHSEVSTYMVYLDPLLLPPTSQYLYLFTLTHPLSAAAAVLLPQHIDDRSYFLV